MHGRNNGEMNRIKLYYYISILSFGANDPLILELYLHRFSSEDGPDCSGQAISWQAQ